jgi:AraC-like DNA-binding protein
MLSIRCKLVLKTELEKLGITHGPIWLGGVNTNGNFSAEQRLLLSDALLKSGLVLMDDKNSLIVEKTKEVIVEMVHYAKEFPKENFSEYISNHLEMSYLSISTIFSEVTGLTVENYIIAHKIDCAKELLLFGHDSLSQIAFDLNYSSTSHLSNQFKKVTGMTPTEFKNVMSERDLQLD